MTKIDIFSGFLGAGKTTLIKKLIKEAYAGQKIVLIENEFGEIGIDGGFMKEAGVIVNELNSGCICCSLTGDFREALKEVIERFEPDRILIEPSGVGKLSDVITAVMSVEGIELNGLTTVADANKAKMYIKNFGEFFTNQVEFAKCIILSRTRDISEAKLSACIELLRQYNTNATIITTDWDALNGAQMLSAIERRDTLSSQLEALLAQTDFDIDDDDDDEDEDEHEHHYHEEEHEHHHHEDEDEHDEHEHHHHHHHHHHHDGDEHDADEIFESWGVETAKKFTEEDIASALKALDDNEKFGIVLRAKGIVDAGDGNSWIHFDYVPGEMNIRRGSAEITGRLCVIGSELKEEAIENLFLKA